MSKNDSDLTPAFAALFEVCSCGGEECPVCEGFQLTPRTAAVLWHCLQVLSDQAYDDVRSFGDDFVDVNELWVVFDRYPRITFGQNAVWRRQAARCFDDLADDLEAGKWLADSWPRCNGEEMALHLALEDAEGAVNDRPEEIAPLVEHLPTHDADFDWSMLSEVCFQDHDVLMLFDAELDGIEDPETALNEWMHIGDMGPQSWFSPFGNVEPRDGRRPFRK